MSAIAFDDDGRFDGINDRSQLAQAEWALRVRLNERHMADGVTMRDPSTVYLDWDVELAPDVELEPNVILRGRTSVGQGTVIGSGAELIDSVVGANCRVWASIVESSRIEDEASGRSPTCARRHGRSWRRGRQLRRAQEREPRCGREAAPHELPGRCRDRRAREHRRRHDHGQLRRHAEAPHADRRRCVRRRRHDDRRPARHRRRCQDRRGSRRHRDVPPGKLAVGMPARIREPRQRPPEPAAEPPLEPAPDDGTG